MRDFVTIDEIMKPVNYGKIDAFIARFNELIYMKVNTMNTAFDKCPLLNDLEFEEVVKKAKENGYNLTREVDKYKVTTYTIMSTRSKQVNDSSASSNLNSNTNTNTNTNTNSNYNGNHKSQPTLDL